MEYRVIYTESAIRDLSCLQKKIAERIAHKITFFREQADPLRFAKKLVGSPIGSYRFRVGDYRVLFDMDRKGEISILMILRIAHRKDVYEL